MQRSRSLSQNIKILTNPINNATKSITYLLNLPKHKKVRCCSTPCYSDMFLYRKATKSCLLVTLQKYMSQYTLQIKISSHSYYALNDLQQIFQVTHNKATGIVSGWDY